MDSITQVVLGAAVGEATLGRRVGRKAALWGALCGTLPDLDVLLPFADPVANFTYHRSFSHSVIVLAGLTPLVVWIIRNIHPADAQHRLGWHALVYLAFVTHVLLDACTIYGTQLLWPLNTTPVGIGSVFIIDPAYTLLLLGGLCALALCRQNRARGRWLNGLGLMLGSLYLMWSFAAQRHVQRVAEAALAAANIPHQQIVALAAPLTTLAWRIVAMQPDGYQVGWYSLLQSGRDIDFRRYASDPALLAGMHAHWPVQRLQWFTKGFNRVALDGADIVITDLRMGVEGRYVFGFKVGTLTASGPQPVPAQLRSARPGLEDMPELWQIIKGNQP